jgi:DNA topoisomerase-1
MGKSLVIVESPAKAKTINKYLGNQFIVKSSIGHIRDLPVSASANKKTIDTKARALEAAKTRKMAPAEKARYKKKKSKEQLISRMGINPEKGWQARYEILPGKEKVVNELQRLAANADHIYLATDLDREGEAIAWHLQQVIGGDDARYKRVIFNEITKKAINAAFEQPGKLDLNRVNAQHARRYLDRVVGFMVSPLLWAKVARGLSAGRVQSVAVRLIVEREREIRKFIPEEYWDVHADLKRGAKEQTRFIVSKESGKAFRPGTKAHTDAALEKLKAASYEVVERKDRPTSSKPNPPFITSTLQQAASTRLGFSVKKTMMMAQRLYEGGYITYMRTDSTNLSADAVNVCRDYLKTSFGEKYLPESPRIYSAKKNAQEAHEAIRPADVLIKSTQLSNMERDAERLYELIWRQFVACQMPNAEFLSSSITVKADDFELRAKGRILKFDGFLKVMPASKNDEDITLPELNEGDVMSLVELHPKQHFTKPVARFTEAALVKEMEKRGIGRPSTYASIISTIQDRGYVSLKNRRFYAEKMGDIVTDRLVENFDDLMDYSFTATMEEHLDNIAQGNVDWKKVLDTFYKDFLARLETAQAEDGGMRSNSPTETDIKCPVCGKNMQIRTASTGVFLGCSGYSLPPKERCKETINLIPGEESVDADVDDEGESKLLITKRRCPKCDTAMDSYLIDKTRKLHVCGNNPDCPGFEVETGQFKIKGYDGPVIQCDKCSADMQLKSGRFGKYFGCTSADCKNTRKLLRNGEAAPPKMDPVPMPELACQKVEDTYILRDGAAGMFLAASKFPKNRETRAPLVSELIPHKDEIDPKYHFLLGAPVSDPDGNPAIIRFSRKTKEQYVMSEKDSKATGWSAFYVNGKWHAELKKTKPKPKSKAKAKARAKPKNKD